MMAPRNSFSACLLAKENRIGRAHLDLVNQGHVNPLGPEVHRESGGFTPCNVYPVKWEPYFTGAYPACPVDRNYCTGVESLTIPLGQTLFHWGLQFQKRFSKSSTSSVLVELFYAYSVE